MYQKLHGAEVLDCGICNSMCGWQSNASFVEIPASEAMHANVSRFVSRLGGLALLVGSIGPAPVFAQTAISSIGFIESQSRQVSFDTSLTIVGNNLIIPGALNATPQMLVTAVNEAVLEINGSGGIQQIRGSLADVAGLAPDFVVRNTAGIGLLQVRSASEGPTVLGVSSSVPAVTTLALGTTVLTAYTVDLGFLTVFP
jgi:hypothetical protein